MSYRRPPEMSVAVGDAVHVPFGRSERHGIVVGPGDPAKATRDIVTNFGPRAGVAEIAVAVSLAHEHFSSFTTLAPRLAPRTRRGNAPVVAGPVTLLDGTTPSDMGYIDVDAQHPRRILATGPGVSMYRLAALEAARLASTHQVLVLCPTKKVVSEVLAEFVSGAARMDVVPAAAEPSPWRGFVEGSLQIAVATRTAALWSASTPPAIVVVDEAHPGHMEAAQPYINARDVAIRRTAASSTPLTLLTTLPSAAALASRSRLLSVGSSQMWPSVFLVDKSTLAPYERLTPPSVLEKISAARKDKRPAYVIAPHTATRYRCGTCRQSYDTDGQCTRCSKSLRPSNFGPERIAQLYPRATPLSYKDLMTAQPRDGAVVVVFDVSSPAPTSLSSWEPDRHLATTLVAAARLAGPTGTVVCMYDTTLPEPCRDLLVHHNIRRHCKKVWKRLRDESLPPFSKMITVRFKRKTPPKVPSFTGTRVLGPTKTGDEYTVTVIAPVDVPPEVSMWIHQARRRSALRVSVA